MAGKKGGALRYFEGWEGGLVAVGIALTAAMLAVPLEVAPDDVPLPLVDGKLLAATLDRDRALAAAIVPALEREVTHSSASTELYDLRAFGEAFRAYGRAEVSDDVYEVVRARHRLVEAVAKARGVGDDKMLGLRAYQAGLFSAELRRWEDTKKESNELGDLGGGFLRLAVQSGWIESGRIVMDDVLRGIFFKRRWNEVTGLRAPSYDLSLEEQRTFYAFLLTHPYVETGRAADPSDACRAADQWRLRKIEELARVDPVYPYALARGILFYRLGRYPASAQALRDYLGSATDGRYYLRARNYLVAANARAAEEAP